MSFSNNGAGSHFAPSSGEEGHAPYSGVPGHRTPGYGAPGSGTAQRPDDTLQSIYGLPFDSPNGSHATESAPFEPVSSRKPSSPSDTDVFLAVAAQSRGASSQPSLTPAANPVSFATPAPRGAQASSGAPAAWQAPAPSASSAATTAAFPASSSGQGAAPANPLVAARTANAGRSAAGNPNGLFPIQEVDQVSGRGFDMSFNETSRKRTVVIAAIVVAVLALAAVGVFFGLRYKQVSDVRGTIDEAIDLLRDTDGVIVPLDEAIASEVSSGVASGTLSDLMLQSTTTSNSLSSADQLVAEAERSRNLLSADDQEALDAVAGEPEAWVIGGGEVGVEIGIYLSRKGHKASVLEMRDRLAADSTAIHYYSMLEEAWEAEPNFTGITGARVAAIKDGAVEYIDKDGNTQSVPADSVVMSAGMRPNKDLALSFYGCAKEFYMIGDCKKAATIQQGMRSAYATAMRI